MSIHVDFWRESTRPPGTKVREIVMSYDEPEEMTDEEAFERAADLFCVTMRIHDWKTLAHGYEIWRNQVH